MFFLLFLLITVGDRDPRQLIDAGRYQEAETVLRESLADKSDPDRAAALNLLAIVLHRQGRYKEAAEPLREALAIAESQTKRLPYEMVNIYSSVGVNYFERGLNAEALHALQKGYAYAQKIRGSDDPDTAQALNNLGSLAAGCKRYDEAEPLFRKALDIQIRHLGAGHPKTALVQENLGRVYVARRMFNEAESLFERVLATREKQLGPFHPAVARALISLSTIQILRNDADKAERCSRRAAMIAERTGHAEPLYAAALVAHANALRVQKKYAEAAAMYETALPLLEQEHGPNHPNIAAVLMNLAGAKLGMNEDEQAQALIRRAEAIRGIQSDSGTKPAME